MGQRAILIQLARLGDLVQTLPAITALKERHPDWILDLLCPASLEPVGRMLPGISKVVKWDGAAWNRRAMHAEAEVRSEHLTEADAEFGAIADDLYD
jgi:heptosyltransferase I